MARKAKLRAPQGVVQELEEALRHLRALIDDDDDTCGIEGFVMGGVFPPRELTTVKSHVRPYVATWIIPDIEKALRWARGGKAT